MRIDITTLSDYHDCETCGRNYADGGHVYVDGKLVLSREPVSYCYGAPSFTEDDLLVMALKKIGVIVFVDGEPYFVSSHDHEYHEYKLGAEE